MRIQNWESLFVTIVQSSLNPTDKSPVIVDATIWDGRRIMACDVQQEGFDVQGSCGEKEVRGFAKNVAPHINALVDHGKSFVVEAIYNDGQRRKLKWTIMSAPEAAQ